MRIDAERPSRPTCRRWMELTGVTAGERGFEERMFACSICHQTEKVIFPVDPLKTDAVGRLAGDCRATGAAHDSAIAAPVMGPRELSEKDEIDRVSLPNEAWAQGPAFGYASISTLVV
jgi:hypothetical protein